MKLIKIIKYKDIGTIELAVCTWLANYMTMNNINSMDANSKLLYILLIVMIWLPILIKFFRGKLCK